MNKHITDHHNIIKVKRKVQTKYMLRQDNETRTRNFKKCRDFTTV
jgi:hypothetical protein